MRQLLFLVGATATGKTPVALEVARILPVEIVSLDSMTVYRGMDIGTAKPTPAERAQVPHHLIDIVEPSSPYSVGRYLSDAERVLWEIESRGRQALFVGGTPLYLKVMTRGLFSGPGADAQLRRSLETKAEREGPQALHDELMRVDPVSAGRIHPNNVKRVIRALEVFHKTGRTISEQQTEWVMPRTDRRSLIAGLVRDRRDLYERIDARVDAMFEAGLVEEVRGLLKEFGTLSREASQALGYREVLAYLAGKADLDETIERVRRNTRRMAKRQMTWFRSCEGIRWFTVERASQTEALAREIADFFASELQKVSPAERDLRRR